MQATHEQDDPLSNQFRVIAQEIREILPCEGIDSVRHNGYGVS
jgi:hypothetical protein